MYKEIARYQTADGAIFSSEKAARQHFVDCFGQSMDNFLKTYFKQMHGSSAFEAILEMTNSPLLVEQQLKELLYQLEYRDED